MVTVRTEKGYASKTFWGNSGYKSLWVYQYDKVHQGLHVTGLLISPWPDQEGKKLQRQKILMFIYPVYNHNWRNISIIYITRLASNEIFSPSNKIHREVGRAKDLSAPWYVLHVLQGAK